jgi:hypothetical protein
MSIEKLNALRAEAANHNDNEKIVDINKVYINPTDSKEDRIVKFIDSVRNPYEIKSNGIVIKANFNNSGKTFENAIIDYYKTAV